MVVVVVVLVDLILSSCLGRLPLRAVLPGMLAGLRLIALLFLSLLLAEPVDGVTDRLPVAPAAGSRTVTRSTGAAKKQRKNKERAETTNAGKRPLQDDKNTNEDDKGL